MLVNMDEQIWAKYQSTYKQLFAQLHDQFNEHLKKKYNFTGKNAEELYVSAK